MSGTPEERAHDLPESSVRLSRIARPAFVVGALALLAVTVVLAFVAGMSVRAPGVKTEAAAARQPVTVRVEKRVVQEGIELPAEVISSEEIKLRLAGEGVLDGVANGGTKADRN
ncbi:MAG: hypothetical protein QM606_08740, partial [Leucobacter sp.]